VLLNADLRRHLISLLPLLGLWVGRSPQLRPRLRRRSDDNDGSQSQCWHGSLRRSNAVQQCRAKANRVFHRPTCGSQSRCTVIVMTTA